MSLALTLLAANLQGSPGRVDPYFDTAFGVDHAVGILGVQDTGQVVLLGPITDPGGDTRIRIVRLRSDGRLDRVLSVEVDAGATFDAFTLLPDGRILAPAGAIASAGVTRSGLLRLLPTGESDPGFSSPALVPRRILRQIDGRILVELADGRGIVRLNDDGSIDDHFRRVPDPNGMTMLGLQTDDRILASRSLIAGDGGGGIELIRLTNTGDLDPTFAVRSMVGLSRLLVGVQPDGRIVLGTPGKSPPNGIFRLHAGGSPDLTFDAGGAVSRDSVDDSWLTVITAGPDGAVYIGGSIEAKHEDYMGGDDAYEQGFVRRLDARHGGEDRTFDVRLSGGWPGQPNSVHQIVVQPDGRLLIAGTFTVVNGAVRRSLARLESNGRLDASFNANQGADAPVLALLPLADGSLVAGGGPGQDRGVGGGPGRRPLDFIQPDGALDPDREVAFPITDREGETVKTLARQRDGAILVGAVDSGIVRFRPDGSRDTAFVPEIIPLEAYLLLAEPDDQILVAATGFLRPRGGGQIPAGVVRLRADGSHDPSYGADVVVSGVITAMDRSPEGRLVVGGEFDQISGVPRKHLARLDAFGHLDLTFDAGPGPDGSVRCLARQQDGRLLVGGGFQNFAGGSRRALVRLHADGAVDASFDAKLLLSAEPAETRISSLLIQPDGGILIGGRFDRVGDHVRRNIARLLPEGRGDPEFQSDRGVDGEVLALALREDGRVVIGGDFRSVDGVPRRYVAQLLGRRENEVRLGPWRWLAGRPAFELSSVVPRSVTVEVSADLIHWSPVHTQVLDANPVLLTNAAPALLPWQFIRASWGP